MTVEFQKWQSLGNDYIVFDALETNLTLTVEQIVSLCDRHRGIGGDGIIVLSPSEQPGFIVRFSVFNPDGSEAELSGNGARQAAIYLHNHRAAGNHFSMLSKAGEVLVTVANDEECTLDLGSARLISDFYPSGACDGIGTMSVNDRNLRFQHLSIGNPQCAIRMADFDELMMLNIDEFGSQIETASIFPQRTNVSFWTEVEPGRIRARIFERGVGETSASGTGASGAAAAYVIDGGSSPVAVDLDGGQLTVEINEALQIRLCGAAKQIYRGSIDLNLA